jgi:branched-chain amino acid transport system ATP-binding protein
MLRLNNVTIKYGPAIAVRGASLEVGSSETVALIGPNGAGKTTIALAIAGLLRPSSGEIEVRTPGRLRSLIGEPAWAVARSGIAYVPEKKSVFERLSVEENLMVAFAAVPVRGARVRADLLSRIYEEFPLLRERVAQHAGTLSGGQRKMLAIARALLFVRVAKAECGARSGDFSLIMIDEPTSGLHPSAVRMVHDVIGRLNESGLAVLIIEQVAAFALGLSTRSYLMRGGEIVASGQSGEMLSNPNLSGLYLGLPPRAHE